MPCDLWTVIRSRVCVTRSHGAALQERYQSFWNATDWKKTCDSFFDESGIPNAPCILLANKADLSNEHKFAHVRSADMMADVCRDHGYPSWHAVSALEGTGLTDTATTAFDALIDKMLEWDAAGQTPQGLGVACRCVEGCAQRLVGTGNTEHEQTQQ